MHEVHDRLLAKVVLPGLHGVLLPLLESTGCDQRKTCCTYFRYGQCRQDIACSGPVTCRVVSCTPPWQQYGCSTASATDNRTRDHSADCLPGQCAGPIADRYAVLGGTGGVLGRALTGGLPTPDGVGRYVQYERGLSYWTPTTEAWGVWGAIRHRYAALRWEVSPLGYPVTDEQATSDGRGRVSRFQGAGSSGAPPTVRSRSTATCTPRGGGSAGSAARSGTPSPGRQPQPVGAESRGSRAASCSGRRRPAPTRSTERSTSTTGLWAGSAGSWATPSATRSPRPAGGSAVSRAAGSTGPRPAAPTSCTARSWSATGPRAGPLGFPVSDEEEVPGGRRSRFQRGVIAWDAATGATRVERS